VVYTLPQILLMLSLIVKKKVHKSNMGSRHNNRCILHFTTIFFFTLKWIKCCFSYTFQKSEITIIKDT